MTEIQLLAVTIWGTESLKLMSFAQAANANF